MVGGGAIEAGKELIADKTGDENDHQGADELERGKAEFSQNTQGKTENSEETQAIENQAVHGNGVEKVVDGFHIGMVISVNASNNCLSSF